MTTSARENTGWSAGWVLVIRTREIDGILPAFSSQGWRGNVLLTAHEY